MADLNEVEYFRRRHEQERQRADQAARPEARMIHSRLADAYAKRLDAAEAASRRTLSIATAPLSS